MRSIVDSDCIFDMTSSSDYIFNITSSSDDNLNIPVVDSTFLLSDSSYGCNAITQFYKSLAIEFDEQRNQLHRFIISQNQKLQIVVQQEVASLAKKLESNVLYLERAKDEIISHATKRVMELEENLSRLEIESQSWRSVAQDNEAMVLSLYNTIEQMQEIRIATKEDKESHCDQNVTNIEGKEENEKENRVKVCKDSQNASFMSLPREHLCS